MKTIYFTVHMIPISGVELGYSVLPANDGGGRNALLRRISYWAFVHASINGDVFDVPCFFLDFHYLFICQLQSDA